MTTAKLAITVPDAAWPAAVTRKFDDVTVTPLAHVARGETGFGLALVAADNLDEVLEAVEAHPSVLEFEVIGRTENEATVEFTTDHPLLLFSSKASGTAIQLPVSFEDGVVTAEVTGSRERLSSLTQHLEALGLEFELVYVQEYSDPGGLLSERQRDLLCTALERGYYDTPRACTLTDLAEEFDIAKSTCSEILHRAESEIITRFVEDLPLVDEPETAQ